MQTPFPEFGNRIPNPARKRNTAAQGGAWPLQGFLDGLSRTGYFTSEEALWDFDSAPLCTRLPIVYFWFGSGGTSPC